MSEASPNLDEQDLARFAAAVREELAAQAALQAAKSRMAKATGELAKIRQELTGQKPAQKPRGRPIKTTDIKDIMSNGQQWTTAALVEKTGRTRQSVTNHLSRMVSRGEIRRVGRTKYVLGKQADTTPAPLTASPDDLDPPDFPAATSEEIVALMRRYRLEWSPSEFVDYLDVDPTSVAPVLESLVKAGTVRKVRKKFVVAD